MASCYWTFIVLSLSDILGFDYYVVSEAVLLILHPVYRIGPLFINVVWQLKGIFLRCKR